MKFSIVPEKSILFVISFNELLSHISARPHALQSNTIFGVANLYTTKFTKIIPLARFVPW